MGFSLKSITKPITSAVRGVTDELGPAAPIIAAVAAPYAIPALAGATGLGSLAAGALYGAGTAGAMSGFDPRSMAQGAALGGLNSGLGQTLGGTANEWLGGNLSPAVQNYLGNAIVGGGVGALTGQGIKRGALGSVMGTALGNAVGSLAGEGGGTATGQGLKSAGNTIAQMMTVGAPVKSALAAGALSGVLSGGLSARRSPLEQAQGYTSEVGQQIEKIDRLLEDPTVPETAKAAYADYKQKLVLGQAQGLGAESALRSAAPGSAEYETAARRFGANESGAPNIYTETGVAPPQSALLGATNLGMNKQTAGAAAMAFIPMMLESVSKAQTPQQVQSAVRSSNPEYFNNLRLQSWDWNDIASKARASGQDLGSYVARNWNTLTASNAYTSPGGSAPQVKMAAGGALSKLAYLAKGAGTGRADTIDARLSDGEYVMDAETVAMLGDGSTEAGAEKLDAMRQQLRKHKGKALARGQISPDAKSPLAYLKGAK